MTAKGGNITASEMGTYSSVLRRDGTLYGEGQGIITTQGGEVATWTGQEIGRFMPEDKVAILLLCFTFYYKLIKTLSNVTISNIFMLLCSLYRYISIFGSVLGYHKNNHLCKG